MTTLRYNYCTQAMPDVGRWVLVWFYTEDIEARWTGRMWVDRDGRMLPDIMCWRVG